ncbi:MAG: HD domain-containing protein [Calditrichaeota bacterium]|nr:MAG: HD domain-containing protein [Calditrichota bacterium]
MDVRLEELTSQIIGKYLGQNLYSSKGSLLLRKGTQISELHYNHIKEMGYQSIYIQENNSNELETDNLVISESLRAKAPTILQDIFKKLTHQDRAIVAEGKKESIVLAENILKEVNFKIKGGLKYLDLKRKSDYLYQHCINVATYSILIGYRLHYHQLKLLDLGLAALLHDIGILFIDNAILSKAGELSPAEFESVKSHTVKGFQHLGRQCFLKGLITIVALQHHERFDGTGYPNGIAGREINEFARIVAVADFFDAYTSDRPYRRMHTIEEAVEKLKAEAGKAFDPDIVEEFLKFF